MIEDLLGLNDPTPVQPVAQAAPIQNEDPLASLMDMAQQPESAAGQSAGMDLFNMMGDAPVAQAASFTAQDF